MEKRHKKKNKKTSEKELSSKENTKAPCLFVIGMDGDGMIEERIEGDFDDGGAPRCSGGYITLSKRWQIDSIMGVQWAGVMSNCSPPQ